MVNILPISMEILACFILSTALLHRYSDMVNNNLITVVAVFISWFFSFMVIFLLPADLTSTAYRQCLFDFQNTINSSTVTPSPSNNLTTTDSLHTSLSDKPIVLGPSIIPQHLTFANQSNFSSPTSPSGFNILELLPNNSISNLTNPCVTPWNYVSDRALTKLWRFIYWTSQVLTWIILPMMQSYSMAGDFTTMDKLKSAVRANLIYYSSYGVIFTVLLIYVIFKNGLDFASLKVIAISSSNTWGLFLLVVLLGYGLVELPRFLINRSKYSQSLSQLYFRVARVNAEKCEAEEKLDDVLEEIHHAFTALGNSEQNPLKRYLMQIVDKCPPDWKRRSNALRRHAAATAPNSVYEPDQSKFQTLNTQSMIRLHKKVISAVHMHRQITCRWNHLIKEVIEWEDVARNQSENQGSFYSRTFKSTFPKERNIIYSIYTSRIEMLWKCLARIWLLRIVGSIMALLSLAVVWSEITFPITIFPLKLSIFAYFVDYFQAAQQYFYLELFSTISIGYLAICAFYTVFHMKIYNIYYLASNKQTEEYSLLFSGMLLCRLTAPLCLNYLCLVHRDSHIIKKNLNLETSFTTIMGHLDLIPIVNNGLNVFLPLCISAICLAIYFNVGTHLLHSLGFEQFIENDEMTIDWVQTGRELVKRETGKLLRNFEQSTATYHEMVSSNSEPIGTTKARQTSRGGQDKPFETNNGSPSSQSSSSSGFSRSSLLTKSRQEEGLDSMPVTHSNQDHRGGQTFGRQEDSVIEFGTNDQELGTVGKPKGFFDDI